MFLEREGEKASAHFFSLGSPQVYINVFELKVMGKNMTVVIPEIQLQDFPIQRGNIVVQEKVQFRSQHLLCPIWPESQLPHL